MQKFQVLRVRNKYNHVPQSKQHTQTNKRSTHTCVALNCLWVVVVLLTVARSWFRSDVKVVQSNMLVGPDDTMLCNCRTRVHEGVWIDNIWTWTEPFDEQCQYHHFSPRRVQAVVDRDCLLFVGDLVSHRTAVTLAKILEHPWGVVPSEVEADQNQENPQFVELLSALKINTLDSRTCVDFLWAANSNDLPTRLKEHNTNKTYSTVIVSIGSHDVNNRLQNHSRIDSSLENLREAMCALQNTSRVIFHTQGYSAFQEFRVYSDLFNHKIRTILFRNSSSFCCEQSGTHVVLVDTAFTSMDRSIGDFRPPHSGLDPHNTGSIVRVNTAQVILNALHWMKVQPHICCQDWPSHTPDFLLHNTTTRSLDESRAQNFATAKPVNSEQRALSEQKCQQKAPAKLLGIVSTQANSVLAGLKFSSSFAAPVLRVWVTGPQANFSAQETLMSSTPNDHFDPCYDLEFRISFQVVPQTEFHLHARVEYESLDASLADYPGVDVPLLPFVGINVFGSPFRFVLPTTTNLGQENRPLCSTLPHPEEHLKDGFWEMKSDNISRWQPFSCQTHVFTKEDAKSCLQHFPLTIAGDSVFGYLKTRILSYTGFVSLWMLQKPFPDVLGLFERFTFGSAMRSGPNDKPVLVLNLAGLWNCAYGVLADWDAGLEAAIAHAFTLGFSKVILATTSAVHPIAFLPPQLSDRVLRDNEHRPKWFMTNTRVVYLNQKAVEIANTKFQDHMLRGELVLWDSWSLYNLRENDPMDPGDMRHFGERTMDEAAQSLFNLICGQTIN